MRKVRYGRFVDFMPPTYDDDCGLIGAHAYIANAQREALKTAGYEYYVEDEGRKVTIDDANYVERMVALMFFVFASNKKRVLGSRSISSVNPYNDPTPQLGTRLDENGDRVVDEGYYENAIQRAIERGDRKAVVDAEKKFREAKEKFRSSRSKDAPEEHNVKKK